MVRFHDLCDGKRMARKLTFLEFRKTFGARYLIGKHG